MTWRRISLGKQHGLPRLHLEALESRCLLATVTVTTALDVIDDHDGKISLREAIMASNINPGPDQVNFDFGVDGPVTIELNHGELEITDSLTITGDGADLLTVDAQQQSRVFNITAETGDFTLAGLTITGGKTTEDNGSGDNSFSGGGIRSLTTGNLTIQNSDVSGNRTLGSATCGGGIWASGDVRLTQSTISDNRAYYRGGGISALGQVTVNSSTISDNRAYYHGGGISALGQVTVNSSTISGNAAGWYFGRGGSGDGGGIYARDVTIMGSTISDNSAGEYYGSGAGGGVAALGRVAVTDSTITGNNSYGDGGGIRALRGVTVSGSTISDNSAWSWVGGGGISCEHLTVTSSTISDNWATYEGGGIRASGNVAVTSSTISGNSVSCGIYRDICKGGGILALGDVTVATSTIAGNSASAFYSAVGGGISGDHVTVTSSAVLDNSIDGEIEGAWGGGISGRAVTLDSRTIAGNSATGWYGIGGGIHGDSVTVTSSTISGNSINGIVDGNFGGGIFGTNVTVSTSTISDNSAGGEYYGGRGGGISGVSLHLESSTISGNAAERGDAGGVYASSAGGGIHSSSVTAISTTISENSADIGGGIYASDNSVRIEHSVVAGNAAGSAPELLLNVEPLSVEYSFIGNNAGTDLKEAPVGAPDADGNLIGGPTYGIIDPLLAPLTDNGGPTLTQALLPGSPAIDAGDPSAIAGAGDTALFDQRGSPYMRVLGSRIDMGAYEWRPPAAVDGDFNDDGLYDCQDIDQLIVAIAVGGNDAAFDMTADGLVNLPDRAAWLAEAGAVNIGPGAYYRPGDANLDGNVDVSDFNIWNSRKFSPLPVVFGWCEGNFNGDGVIDLSDFNVWNDHRFTGVGVLPGLTDGSIEEPEVQARVPLAVVPAEAGVSTKLESRLRMRPDHKLRESRGGRYQETSDSDVRAPRDGAITDELFAMWGDR